MGDRVDGTGRWNLYFSITTCGKVKMIQIGRHEKSEVK